MPDLEILTGSYPEPEPLMHFNNVVNVLAVMLYPESQENRKIFNAGVYEELLKNLVGRNISLNIPVEDIILIAQHQNIPDLINRRRQGLNVGYMLHIVLRCKQHHPGWASLASARTLAEYGLKRNDKERGTRMSKGKDTLDNQWRLMVGVSHYWAAQKDFPGYRWAHPKLFLPFLVLAEELRRIGESHFSPLGRLQADSPIKRVSDKPLLDVNSTWKVPLNLQLPELTTPIQWDPLPPDAYSVLARAKNFSGI